MINIQHSEQRITSRTNEDCSLVHHRGERPKYSRVGVKSAVQLTFLGETEARAKCSKNTKYPRPNSPVHHAHAASAPPLSRSLAHHWSSQPPQQAFPLSELYPDQQAADSYSSSRPRSMRLQRQRHWLQYCPFSSDTPKSQRQPLL